MDSGRLAFGATLAATVWGVALVVAALVAPVYSVMGSSGAHTTATLVEANGEGVLLISAVPLAIAVVVWLALHRFCTTGRRGARNVAWALVILLAGFCLLASVGLFALPAAALLAAAARLTPSGTSGPHGASQRR